MSKVIFSKSAIISLADYVLKNYGHIGEVIDAGIAATKKTYTNSKLTALAIYDLFQTTARYMQAVENEGVLKGLAKKQAVLDFIVKEYLETEAEIKKIWSGWRTTVSWFIDQLITMLNSGRSVLQASTQAALMIAEAAPDDSDVRSAAVLSLVQTELFNALVALQESDNEDADPSDRIMLMAKAGKGIAEIAKASVNQKKWESDVREKVQKAAKAVEAIAKKGGMSKDIVNEVKREILGIIGA